MTIAFLSYILNLVERNIRFMMCYRHPAIRVRPHINPKGTSKRAIAQQSRSVIALEGGGTLEDTPGDQGDKIIMDSNVLTEEEKKKAAENRERKGKLIWFLKIPSDFYQRFECERLMKTAPTRIEGFVRCAIYERMLLLSCKGNGKLRMSSTHPYTPETLAEHIGLSDYAGSKFNDLEDNSKIVIDTIRILEKCGCVEITKDFTFIITTFEELTTSTTEQAWKRKKQRDENSKSLEEKERERIEQQRIIDAAKAKWGC